jgi:hypothetical protein
VLNNFNVSRFIEITWRGEKRNTWIGVWEKAVTLEPGETKITPKKNAEDWISKGNAERYGDEEYISVEKQK